jgi:3-deoxy-D-manno-octulosonic-acid transferase
VHGSSVGEQRVVSTLITGLRKRYPEGWFWASAYTVTGRPSADGYFPIDLSFAVRRALACVRPDLVVLIEGEFWPSFLKIAERESIPVVSLSTHLSERSYRRYRCFGKCSQRMLGRIRCFGVQDETIRQRLLDLGVTSERIRVTGNLKFDVIPRTSGEIPSAWKDWLSGGPSLVAGSTREEEEALVVEAFLKIVGRFPGARLILAPRHPQRFEEVARLLQQKGVNFLRRSRLEEGKGPLPVDRILLLDVMGELPSWYAAGTAAFVGGSLVPVGGHNLLEPASLGKPVCFGPHVENVSEQAELLERSGGGAIVRDVGALADRVGGWFANPSEVERAGEAVRGAVGRARGALARSVDLIDEVLALGRS